MHTEEGDPGIQRLFMYCVVYVHGKHNLGSCNNLMKLKEDNLGGRNTVEYLLTDTPNKGHCIKYLSTMDKESPNFNPPINIMQFLIDDYTVDKPLEFILVPKCPLFVDSTVTHKNNLGGCNNPYKIA